MLLLLLLLRLYNINFLLLLKRQASWLMRDQSSNMSPSCQWCTCRGPYELQLHCWVWHCPDCCVAQQRPPVDWQ